MIRPGLAPHDRVTRISPSGSDSQICCRPPLRPTPTQPCKSSPTSAAARSTRLGPTPSKAISPTAPFACKRRRSRVATTPGSTSYAAPGRPICRVPMPRPSRWAMRLEALIGRGEMGVVHRARQLGLDRRVALKTVAAGRDASPHVIELFRREFEAVASLNHPAIVPIHDVGVCDGLRSMRWNCSKAARWPTASRPARSRSRKSSPWSSASPGPSTMPTAEGSSTAT